ncbi:leucine-rich repeat domain-containing protein [uncultured Aquimarina sp.]|uniref:leucine-rich repeat domain-containing protein n=1 Tax=uncultured Aquimarina sp. TaxID=575652 RepID=UPI0026266E9F|nr:leucine-rich repeat domain-containing protein [uncultured Aquimarina sp.]
MENQIQQIEELLGVTLEKYDYKKEDQVNTYNTWSNDPNIRELVLENVTIDNIHVLLPFSKYLHTLKLINCTIGSISSLYNFENLGNLTLNNVTITNVEELTIENKSCNTAYNGNLMHVNLENMNIKHLGALQPMAKNLDHVFITNCTIHNFYEVNLFPKLYDLRLDGVVIKQSDEDVIYEADSERNFTWLSLFNMEFEDINYFIPISKGLHGITLNGCTIGSIRKLIEFTSLQEFEIDASTVINDVALEKENRALFRLKECIISANEDDVKVIDFDIQKLAAIATSIETITFKNDAISNLSYLTNFEVLTALKFDRITARLSYFLPIAAQISSLDFSESTIKNRSQIQHFKNLEVLKIDANTSKESFKDFKTLLPLKNQLKKFDFWEFSDCSIKNLACIEQFTALESVFILYASKKVAQRVFSLPSLKKLSINIRAKKAQTFNVETLKNIEELYIENDNSVTLKGLESLQHLRVLSLKDSCNAKGIHKIKKLQYLKINEAISISELPAINTLTKLEIDVTEAYEVSGLSQFINLKELSIKGTNKITLGHLPNLRVLDISNIFPKEIDFLYDLPNLEKLSLENNCLTEVKGVDKLTNLNMLNISENTIENIEGLANLKNLAYLNLYENKISDITILNDLPNLKQVNIAGNLIEKPKALKQLSNPKIAVFYGLPKVPFWIWEDQDFEL